MFLLFWYNLTAWSTKKYCLPVTQGHNWHVDYLSVILFLLWMSSTCLTCLCSKQSNCVKVSKFDDTLDSFWLCMHWYLYITVFLLPYVHFMKFPSTVSLYFISSLHFGIIIYIPSINSLKKKKVLGWWVPFYQNDPLKCVRVLRHEPHTLVQTILEYSPWAHKPT